MRMRFALAAVASFLTTSAGHALQSQDSQPWIAHVFADETAQLRWRLSAESTTGNELLFFDTDQNSEDVDVTRLSGQIDNRLVSLGLSDGERVRVYPAGQGAPEDRPMQVTNHFHVPNADVDGFRRNQSRVAADTYSSMQTAARRQRVTS